MPGPDRPGAAARARRPARTPGLIRIGGVPVAGRDLVDPAGDEAALDPAVLPGGGVGRGDAMGVGHAWSPHSKGQYEGRRTLSQVRRSSYNPKPCRRGSPPCPSPARWTPLTWPIA